MLAVILLLHCLIIAASSVPPKTVAAPGNTETRQVRVLRWLSDGAKEGIASALATSVVKAALQPLDTIKTVQQRQSIGPFLATRRVIESRGLGGLWSGLGVTLLGSAPSAAVYFGSYSSIKRRLLLVMPPRLKLLSYALSASMGNTLASVFRVPYEVIKQRMQCGMFDSTWAAIADCWRNEGITGLFGGGKLTSQIARDVPYAVATLVTYEVLQVAAHAYLASTQERNTTTSSKTGNLLNALCGSLAGGFGSLVTNPMDVVKTRMMTSRRYPSVAAAARAIYRDEGPAAFMIGVVPRLMHKVPANGLFFLFYEWFRLLLGVKGRI